jgi:signal transduction histidine kinase
MLMKKKKSQNLSQHAPELQSEAITPDTQVVSSGTSYHFLKDASLQLSASLDYETTLATITGLAVPALADYCLIDLLTPSGRLCRVATVHSVPAEAALLKRELRYPPDPGALDHPVAKVLRTRRSELHHEITDTHLQATARDDEHLQILRELGPTSGMVVPLLAHGQLVGTLSLGAVRRARHYTQADVTIAEGFAEYAAAALINAQRYKDALEGLRAREQFLSIAAHELKNPLTTLLGSIEHLQRRIDRMAQAQERDRQITERIREQTLRLTQMVDSLLDIARVDTGHFNLVRAPIDLASLTRRLIADLQPTSPQHRFVVTVLDDPLIVYGDAVRLEQVLQNLLGNAMKYSPDGGRIDVQLARRGDVATVVVTDQGIGIPQSALPYLFQRFFRASNAEGRQIDGIGLGLSLVKEIVSLHGGTVTVASEEGRGSSFTIALPLREANSSAEPRLSEPQSQVVRDSPQLLS